jgi:amino acid transporter
MYTWGWIGIIIGLLLIIASIGVYLYYQPDSQTGETRGSKTSFTEQEKYTVIAVGIAGGILLLISIAIVVWSNYAVEKVSPTELKNEKQQATKTLVRR